MALSDLLRALDEAAAARRRDIIESARAEAARIAAEDAARDAEAAALRRARLLADRRASADERAAEARRSAGRRLTAVHRETIDRVMAAARARLGGELAAHREHVDILVGQAVAHLDRPAVARCPPPIAPEVRAALDRRNLPIEVEVALDPDADAGVVLLARDGTLAIDATLEAALEQARAEIEIDLVRRIEGGGP